MKTGMFPGLARLFFLLLGLIGTPASFAQSVYCDPAFSFGPALGPYIVRDTSHIVVMEYTVWFGALIDQPSSGALPFLARQDQYQIPGRETYSSGDCRVIGQHARWLIDNGVDAIAVDLSNAVRCIFQDPTNVCDSYRKFQDNVSAIYKYYSEHNVPLRIIPLLGAQDMDALTMPGTNDYTTNTGFALGLGFFKTLADKYPNQVVRYKNKPLMLLYVGTPASRNGTNFMDNAYSAVQASGLQDFFTYRFVTGYTDSQADLWDSSASGIPGLHQLATPEYPVWSWIDRLNPDPAYQYMPSYSLDPVGGKPENLTITMGFPGQVAWDGSDARHRSSPGLNQQVLNEFIEKAKQLQPTFLFVNGFNEFSAPDQGGTAANSNDLEPSDQWDMRYLNAVGTKLNSEYKPALARVLNISTRNWVGTGTDVLISGFQIGGPTPKKVLIRAVGPNLANYGVTGVLANPTLQLYSGQTVIASNDDWGTSSNAAAIQATGLAPVQLESAILTTLNPGPYTAIVSGVGASTGVGMVEVFEMDQPGSPLDNISARGKVLAGTNVMIGGFIIEGTKPKTVLLRAVGPNLANYGVQGVLANPKLDLYSGSNIIVSNDDWQGAANAAAIQATGLAPVSPLESAILVTLTPGAYTAIVSGSDGGTGVGIFEVFAQ